MGLHRIDIVIIVGYMAVSVIAGVLVMKLSSRNIGHYFLGGNAVPWYFLGMANASGMFDITGTMWLVSMLFIYGLKSTWLPWAWPTFNQVFLFVYLNLWLRRSGVMTGAEWIRTRFGSSTGAKLSDISVVIFALVMTIGMLAYAFQGVGKFTKVFLPWDLSADSYAIIIMGVSSVYIILGGMLGVLVTNIIQFLLMASCSVAVAIIAVRHTIAAQIAASVPQGWYNLLFGWKLNVDWSHLIPSITQKIGEDGFSFFTIIFMMMLFKGVLASMAGPAPNYDMQRVLSARSPRESALMSWLVVVVLNIPQYFLAAGIVALGLVFFSGRLVAMGPNADLEQILPYVIENFIPVGLTGFVLAGLFAAFMSTYSGTVNCGASYVVNDIYKRYINPNAPTRRYVLLSYISSASIIVLGIVFGFFTKSIYSITLWITGGLWGGYIAANFLKWYWWRFNGFGYFAGMISGIAAALVLPRIFPGPVLFHIQRDLALFPMILLFSVACCILVTMATPPDGEKVLRDFYKKVRPWGFWGPIRDRVLAENPGFQPNTAFRRDMLNVVIGIIWQTTLTLIPVYLVVRHYRALWISLVILAATSVLLKFSWYDKLERD